MSGTISVAVSREGRSSRLSAVTCTFGRHDKPYPEIHEGAWTVALVQRGAFKYRGSATNHRHILRAGWLILGPPHAEFECSHDRDGGDMCSSLTIAEEIFWDVADAAGASRTRLLASSPVLPPIPRVAALLERARLHDGADIDEVAYLVAESAIAQAAQQPPRDVAHHPSHIGRIQDVLDYLETSSADTISLADLATSAGFSPFHFLRVFRQVTGTTPHQYLIGARLRRAVQLLIDTDRPVTRIAFDVGFQDLSNFIRTFRRVIGCSPRAYRSRLGVRR